MMRLLMAFILAAGLAAPLCAQNVLVKLRADSTQILIGDWFQATLSVQAPSDYRIEFPQTDAGFSSAAYVDSDSAIQEQGAGDISYSKVYTLTTFDTGSVAITANVTYYKPGDTTTYVATSNDIPMDVVTVRLDTTGSYRDIKDVLDVAYTWWDYVLFFAAGLAALMLLWFGWHHWKSRPETEAAADIPEPEPAIPPEVLALDRLRALEQKKLWEQGEHKEYQSELTEIIREYIEGKFLVPALEETTPEIIGHIALKGIEPKLISEIELALQCADLTKFAKYQPDAVAHRQGLKTAYLFVDETKDYIDSVESDALRKMATSPSASEAPRPVEPAIAPAPEEPRPGEPPVDANPEMDATPETDERSDDDVRS